MVLTIKPALVYQEWLLLSLSRCFNILDSPVPSSCRVVARSVGSQLKAKLKERSRHSIHHFRFIRADNAMFNFFLSSYFSLDEVKPKIEIFGEGGRCVFLEAMFEAAAEFGSIGAVFLAFCAVTLIKRKSRVPQLQGVQG